MHTSVRHLTYVLSLQEVKLKAYATKVAMEMVKQNTLSFMGDLLCVGIWQGACEVDSDHWHSL